MRAADADAGVPAPQRTDATRSCSTCSTPRSSRSTRGGGQGPARRGDRRRSLAECDFNEFQIAHLNHPTAGRPSLRRISFFIRLWRRLGWTMRELDSYLMSLEGGVIPARTQQVSVVKRLIDSCSCEPRQCSRSGRTSTRAAPIRNKKSLFDETFLFGTPINRSWSTSRGRPRRLVTAAGPRPLTGRGSQDARAGRAWPQGGRDRSALADHRATSPRGAQQDLPDRDVFSHALGISVRRLLRLRRADWQRSVGPDGRSSPPPACGPDHQGVRALDIAGQSTAGRAMIQYYLTDFSKPGDTSVAKRADLDTSAQRARRPLSAEIACVAASLRTTPTRRR